MTMAGSLSWPRARSRGMGARRPEVGALSCRLNEWLNFDAGLTPESFSVRRAKLYP